MKLFDIVQIIGVITVIVLAATGLLKRKVLNVLLLIYVEILIASSIYYAVNYFHVVTSAPLIVYVAINVAWSVVCLATLGAVRLVLGRRLK